MVKVVFRKGDIKKGVKYGLFAGMGSVLFIVGLIVVLTVLIKGTKSEKELWCPIGIASVFIGWGIVRQVGKSTGVAISTILISSLINPF